MPYQKWEEVECIKCKRKHPPNLHCAGILGVMKAASGKTFQGSPVSQTEAQRGGASVCPRRSPEARELAATPPPGAQNLVSPNRVGPIRLNRISSDPLPSTDCNPPHPEDRNNMISVISGSRPPREGFNKHQNPPHTVDPSMQPANHLQGIITNTLFSNEHPPHANPFDQRTPHMKSGLTRDPRLKAKGSASTSSGLLPPSRGQPPNLIPKPPKVSMPAALSSKVTQPHSQAPYLPSAPAPPTLPPGWQQTANIPEPDVANPKPKVAAAHGWKGWSSEHPLRPPSREAKPQAIQGLSLSQLLEQQVTPRERDEEAGGVSPPRTNMPPVMANLGDQSGAHVVPVPLLLPSIAEQPVLPEHSSSGPTMVICPLCPAPGYVPQTDLEHARIQHKDSSFSCAECLSFFVSFDQVKEHVSSKHKMSRDIAPLLIHLPARKESLLAWKCLAAGGPHCSSSIFLDQEKLEAHITSTHGKQMLKCFKDPKRSQKVANRVCRICLCKADQVDGHGCNLEAFAPLEEDAPVLEGGEDFDALRAKLERSSSSPSPEVELVQDFDSHRPMQSAADMEAQVEELLNKSKDLSQEKLEVKMETVRKSRKELETQKMKKRRKRRSSSSSSSNSSDSSSSSEERPKRKTKEIKDRDSKQRDRKALEQRLAAVESALERKKNAQCTSKPCSSKPEDESLVNRSQEANIKTVSKGDETENVCRQTSEPVSSVLRNPVVVTQQQPIDSAPKPPSGFVQSFQPVFSSPPASSSGALPSSSPLSSSAQRIQIGPDGPILNNVESMCNFCTKVASKQQLEAHTAQEHKVDMFECLVDKCGYLEPNARMLISHLSYTHSMPTAKVEGLEELASKGEVRLPLGLASWKCKVCKQIFLGTEAKTLLLCHMKEAHRKTKEKTGSFQLHCRLCNIQVAGEIEMQQHQEAHFVRVGGGRGVANEGESASSPSYVAPGSSPIYSAPGSQEDGEVLSQEDDVLEIKELPAGEPSKKRVPEKIEQRRSSSRSRRESSRAYRNREGRSSDRSRSSSRSRDNRDRDRSQERKKRHSQDRGESRSSYGSRSSRRSRSGFTRSPSRRSPSQGRYYNYSRRMSGENIFDREAHCWSSRDEYEENERSRRGRLDFERLRQSDSNRSSNTRRFFCQVCNISSTSQQMHDKHERSKKHLDNVATADQNEERSRRRRGSDDSDVVIIEGQSDKISDKNQDTAQFVEDQHKEVEEKLGDCTDCLSPMGDPMAHWREKHHDLFISCRLCLQAGYSPFLVQSWDELREHLRGSAHNKLDSETRNPDLTFFAKVDISLSRGVACCNLCPPNTSFWTSDGSGSCRKVLESRITFHMKLRHPRSSGGWAPWGSAVSLQCKACAFATSSPSEWGKHLNECKHLLSKIPSKTTDKAEERDQQMCSSRQDNKRSSGERYSRSPRRSWSPRREPWDFNWGRRRSQERRRSRSRGRRMGNWRSEHDDWRSGQQRRSPSPELPFCKICGEKVNEDLPVHLAHRHPDLSFRCAAASPTVCRLHFATLQEATQHLRQKHAATYEANRLPLLTLPGAMQFNSTKEKLAAHLEKCHPGEGLENINIFCRVCEPHITRAQNNFEDEQELSLHMEEKHGDLLRQIRAKKM